MTGKRKGTPCACETDPCSCGSSKGKCIRTINNLSPDPNGDFFIEAGSGITITQTGDNSFEVSFDGTFPSNPLIYKGTVGSGGTVAVLPAADPDNIGWCYIAIEAATSPVTYEVGDVLISDGYTWQVVPSGDEIVPIVTAWQATPDDQHIPSEKLVKDSLDTKADTATTLAGYGITDAVDLSSAQTITGSKRLSNTATFTTANLSFVLQGTAPHGTIPTSNDYKEFAYRMSGNNTNHGLITFITEAATGNGNIRIRMCDYAGANPADFNIFSGSDKYMTGPSRAYNASNTSDVATIGTLDAYTPMVRTTGNQTIIGYKKHNAALYALAQQWVKSRAATIADGANTWIDAFSWPSTGNYNHMVFEVHYSYGDADNMAQIVVNTQHTSATPIIYEYSSKSKSTAIAFVTDWCKCAKDTSGNWHLFINTHPSTHTVYALVYAKLTSLTNPYSTQDNMNMIYNVTYSSDPDALVKEPASPDYTGITSIDRT